jgi:hypothetical protein
VHWAPYLESFRRGIDAKREQAGAVVGNGIVVFIFHQGCLKRTAATKVLVLDLDDVSLVLELIRGDLGDKL